MFFEDPQEALRARFADDDREAAQALLDDCQRGLTGRETTVCERIASTKQDDFALFDFETVDRWLFDSLKTQFAREIAAWKDGVRA